MAKVVFGPLVTDVRKKISGVVFSKAHFGAYTRKKVSPVQPRTTAQRAVRANFTATSKAWSGTLSATERATFVALAASLTKKDHFGQSYTQTGAQLYMSITRNLHTIGLAPLTSAPQTQSVSDLGGLLLQEITSPDSPYLGPGLKITPTNNPASGEGMVITATAPEPAGRAFVGKSRYRIIGYISVWPTSPATSFPLDITEMYQTKFGQLESGQTIHVQVNNINSTNGAAGKPYPASITLS
jgi:hypothetical protein